MVYVVNAWGRTVVDVDIVGSRSRAHCVRQDAPSYFSDHCHASPDLTGTEADDLLARLTLGWALYRPHSAGGSRRTRVVSADGVGAAMWIDCAGGHWRVGARNRKKATDFQCHVEECGMYFESARGLSIHIGQVHSSRRRTTSAAPALAPASSAGDDDADDERESAGQPRGAPRSQRPRRPFQSARYGAPSELAHGGDSESDRASTVDFAQLSEGSSEEALMYQSDESGRRGSPSGSSSSSSSSSSSGSSGSSRSSGVPPVVGAAGGPVSLLGGVGGGGGREDGKYY